MPGCVLRLSGPYESLAVSLSNAFVLFKESRATEAKRERGLATTRDEATFNHVVSKADGYHVRRQIEDTIAFLSAHMEELMELRFRPGVDHAMLDFGWVIPTDRICQFHRFPLSLLTLCVQTRIEIEISVYLQEDEEPGL